ncbi:hypothetical protein H696_04108 [Fonticula alba]|uniref:Aminoacyl-transfer RNA synthetases class-II family profile domain-containing protein n=1 Tax=Fonticula alba TaxID=691883 RepID=A0A058Z602_FONAL|nr:hypothetical protein H696_04108 [Fonticula alba]KCV69700.1 hypothetical protein H696_04108 [Fonticula alba]|eukprot:XP_009496265.1 hypothetical protein H696_04108 [Fonticula alba]
MPPLLRALPLAAWRSCRGLTGCVPRRPAGAWSRALSSLAADAAGRPAPVDPAPSAGCPAPAAPGPGADLHWNFEPRSHLCGDISEGLVGQSVRLNGWLQNPRSMSEQLVFRTLRDHSGVAQLVWEAPAGGLPAVGDLLRSLPLETVVQLTGTVISRPDASKRQHAGAGVTDGLVEVAVHTITPLGRPVASGLPFPIGTGKAPGPAAAVQDDRLKLQYRYLDLRAAGLQGNLRQRHRTLRTARRILDAAGFVEIETPTLFKATSEGAREFLVPARAPGRFYALPQSPQQYKQLLMVAGFDRYYQVARCWRDEDLRADRQPEFTQLDIEMSYATPAIVKKTVHEVISAIWAEAKGVTLPEEFPVLSFDDAIRMYGSDKPDTRFDMIIHDLSTVARKRSSFAPFRRVFDEAAAGPGGAATLEAFVVPGALPRMSKSAWRALSKASRKGHFVIAAEVTADRGLAAVGASTALFDFPDKQSTGIQAEILGPLGAVPGDTIVFVASPPRLPGAASTEAGRQRLDVFQRLAQLDPAWAEPLLQQDHFLWVEDFPLFTVEHDEQTGEFRRESTHHPFTAPHEEDVGLLFSADPRDHARIRAQHYDLVLNGSELGGGSIRIHRADVQQHVFRHILNLSETQVAEFDHLVEALGYGAPPHGGIALGVDRLVASVVGAASLREVIAFPKSTSGADLTVGSPSAVPTADIRLQELRAALAAGADGHR